MRDSGNIFKKGRRKDGMVACCARSPNGQPKTIRINLFPVAATLPDCLPPSINYSWTWYDMIIRSFSMHFKFKISCQYLSRKQCISNFTSIDETLFSPMKFLSSMKLSPHLWNSLIYLSSLNCMSCHSACLYNIPFNENKTLIKYPSGMA
jgi:hypothetical protein